MMNQVYLCSKSTIKTNVVRNLVDLMTKIRKQQYTLINLDIAYDTVEQPLDETTTMSCFTRLTMAHQHIHSQCTPHLTSIIISLESGLYINDDGNVYDICVMLVYDYDTNSVTRYNSFGIQIDNELFTRYMNSNQFVPTQFTIEPPPDIIFHNKEYIGGYNVTFGKYLKTFFDIQHDNWMLDPRFGKVDRHDQLMDCCNKYLINSSTGIISNYPKEGVLFKDMTTVVVNADLITILYKTLERLIKDNFDISNIDYFAGLDARGFYLAPHVASIFNKGFIPVRKAKKIPFTDRSTLVTESYSTEYSDDELGLKLLPDYLPVNGKVKKVLLFDDLLATGGSLICATNVLRKAGLDVVGAVTIYDVQPLRSLVKQRFTDASLQYKVLINENNLPNDFVPLYYKIPNVALKRLEDHAETNIVTRNYTLSDEEWNQYENYTHDEIACIDTTKMNDIRVIYTEKDKDLAEEILRVLSRQSNVSISDTLRVNVTNGLFSNGETRVKLDTNTRNKNVIIVSQIRTGHVNNDFMELIMILDACSRASAKEITVVLPYYPYSRSDKKDDPRCPIGASVVAKLMENMHVGKLVSLDLHAGQIQGYIDRGFHNLYIKKYMCEYIYANYLKFYTKELLNDMFIIVAPDAGSAKSAKGYSKLLGINNIIMDKERDYSKPSTVAKSRFIGSCEDFKGKTALIIDDMADTMGTMCATVKELVEHGLKDAIVFVTHGILSGPAIDNINNTQCITEVVVTNSLPQKDNVSKSPKIKVLSCAELIARAIDGILTGRSVSRLF